MRAQRRCAKKRQRNNIFEYATKLPLSEDSIRTLNFSQNGPEMADLCSIPTRGGASGESASGGASGESGSTAAEKGRGERQGCERSVKIKSLETTKINQN